MQQEYGWKHNNLKIEGAARKGAYFRVLILMAARSNDLTANKPITSGGAVPWDAELIGNRPDTKLSSLARELQLDLRVALMFKDADLHAAFVAAVPDESLQARYLTQTSNYLGRAESDPNFVLVLRRALPSPTAKPEAHWTTEYTTAVTGLTREIPPGPHRHHSVILCASLAEILADGGRDPGKGGVSDGEIRVISHSFDQARALFCYKPKHEVARLEEYLQQDGALDLEQTRELVNNGRLRRNRGPEMERHVSVIPAPTQFPETW